MRHGADVESGADGAQVGEKNIDLVAAGDIGLGDEAKIRLGDLCADFGRVAQLGRPEHAVDGDNDAAKTATSAQAHRFRKIAHDGAGVGQPRGLDQDAGECGNLAGRLLREQVADGVDQIAADRTAHAAIVEHQDIVERRLDQQMIEPDFAEFIDDQRAVRHPRLADEAAQQRRLSAPEKSGDKENRNVGSVIVAVKLHPRHLAPLAAIGA